MRSIDKLKKDLEVKEERLLTAYKDDDAFINVQMYCQDKNVGFVFEHRKDNEDGEYMLREVFDAKSTEAKLDCDVVGSMFTVDELVEFAKDSGVDQTLLWIYVRWTNDPGSWIKKDVTFLM